MTIDIDSEKHAKKVYVFSNGCIPNRLYGKKIEYFFKSNGWKVSDDPSDSELIIFNTCGFNGAKIKETMKIINIFETEKKDGAELIVTGCIPKIVKDLKNIVAESQVLNISELKEKFHSKNELDDLYVSGSICDILEVAKSNIYHIITSTGCKGRCSYCIIKAARGSIRSKPINEVKNEFNSAIKKKYRKFILWGDDLGAYGSDISTNFVELLRTLIGSTPTDLDYQISLYRLNAQWMIKYFEEFVHLLGSEKIDMIYSPIQSGSEKILKLMRREYTAKEVIHCFKLLKKACPSLHLKTDIMVGFPSESKSDFQDTIELIKEIDFDDIAVFIYSGVPNTPAYSFNDQVDDHVKFKRSAVLFDYVKQKKSIQLKQNQQDYS